MPVLLHPPLPYNPFSFESEPRLDSKSEVDSDLEPEVDWAEWGIHDEEVDPDEIAEQEDGEDEIESPLTPPARDIIPLIENDDSDREVETQGKKSRIDLA
jgi:hypothetical protein